MDSKALSPDTVGEPPHPRAAAVARELGLRLRPDKVAIPFDEVTDIVNFDLVAVMDRFDLETVLREVSVFDALNPGGCYSARVRRLGDWAPPPRTSASFAGSVEVSRSLRGDILDPLYGMLRWGMPSACLALTVAVSRCAGHLGGEQETAAIWAAVRLIRAGCRGLLRELTVLAQSAGILCDSSYASLEGSPQSDLSPSELRQCPVLPAEGASAALAAAVEASLPCPLYADEYEDRGWDAAASQQDAYGSPSDHLAPGRPQQATRVSDVRDACPHMYAAILRQRTCRRRLGAAPFGLKAVSCSQCATCVHNLATSSAICCAPRRRCFAFPRVTRRAT